MIRPVGVMKSSSFCVMLGCRGGQRGIPFLAILLKQVDLRSGRGRGRRRACADPKDGGDAREEERIRPWRLTKRNTVCRARARLYPPAAHGSLSMFGRHFSLGASVNPRLLPRFLIFSHVSGVALLLQTSASLSALCNHDARRGLWDCASKLLLFVPDVSRALGDVFSGNVKSEQLQHQTAKEAHASAPDPSSSASSRFNSR